MVTHQLDKYELRPNQLSAIFTLMYMNGQKEGKFESHLLNNIGSTLVFIQFS
jgi:hypothetical protein